MCLIAVRFAVYLSRIGIARVFPVDFVRISRTPACVVFNASRANAVKDFLIR